MIFNDDNLRSERLSIEQIRKIAHCLRTGDTPDPRTALAVADALESVARHRAARILRARMQAQLQSIGSLRRVAAWAVTKL
ncbi:MAG: hypothetical protein ABWZ88_11545 [Variovorax sp.]